jgi:putative addiction module killer protein
VEIGNKVILYYETEAQKCPFLDWLNHLDFAVSSRIDARLKRVVIGNFGDFKSVGDGVNELRFNFGSGYRVYFAQSGEQIVLLLCAGDKSTQEKDIKLAHNYWADFKRRNNA